MSTNLFFGLSSVNKRILTSCAILKPTALASATCIADICNVLISTQALVGVVAITCQQSMVLYHKWYNLIT